MGCLLAATLAATIGTQANEPKPQGIDPYTQGKTDLMVKAGYLSFGPFPLGTKHDSGAVETLLSGEPLLWIETAHFRIGSALSPIRLVGDSEAADKLKPELARLKVKLPRIKLTERNIDPWLRAHLIAQRAETLYEEISKLLGVRDSDFPKSVPHSADLPPRGYYGLGPYFGQPQKFTILLFRKSSSLARYTAAYVGRETNTPLRHYDHAFGNAWFVAAEDANQSGLTDDLALHTHLTYNLAHILYNSYRSYSHDLPAWLICGLAHWHARNICPRFPAYDRAMDDPIETRSFWQWEERVPGLLNNGAFIPLDEFTTNTDITKLGFEGHIQAWALVDFLMTTRQRPTMAFVHGMKDIFHARLRFPTEAELRERQRQCLKEFLDTDWPELERKWRSHVNARKASR